jgi:hypothetical protein
VHGIDDWVLSFLRFYNYATDATMLHTSQIDRKFLRCNGLTVLRLSPRLSPMNAPFAQLSAVQLRTAAEIKEKIDSLQSELNGLLSGAPGQVRRGRGRPANRLSVKSTRLQPVTRKPRRKMSAAAKKKIAAAAKARWAKAKAAGKSTL